MDEVYEHIKKVYEEKMKKKNWTLSKFKKEFWKVFSLYIRMRGEGVCFSCNKTIPDFYNRKGDLLPGWRASQAGHFITAATCGLALYFHEKNVHSQCHYCNINLSGNWVEYEKKIIEVYGQEVCDELKQLKWTGTVKYSMSDYAEMIDKYLDKIVGLGMKGEI